MSKLVKTIFDTCIAKIDEKERTSILDKLYAESNNTRAVFLAQAEEVAKTTFEAKESLAKIFSFAEFLKSKESFFEVTPINFMFLFRDVYWIIFFNSSLCPLLLIKITTSLDVICPKSPWLALEASKKNDGVPVDERVAAHFFPMMPLFPTPEIIIFPFLQFKIVLMIFVNL